MNETFQKYIDEQIKFNQGKNLFYNGMDNPLKFIPETLTAIEKLDELDSSSEDFLIDYTVNKVIMEFCRMNQYYYFNQKAKEDLRKIYAELFSEFKEQEKTLKLISEQHYQKLARWLNETNPFAEKIYSTKNQSIEQVACSEYSHELQIKILQINIREIYEPVLDIGCGTHGNLVHYLRQKGIETYGLERFSENNPSFINADWLDYDFGKNKWGTIISHLAFSNHFLHHHYRSDGQFIRYAKKYMDILNSLKIGGTFCYTPGLAFIETYLDKNKFRLTSQKIGNCDFQSIKIKRL